MKDIIVFGTGAYFQHKKNQIEKNYHIKYFLDNKVTPGSSMFYENTAIKILNPMDQNIDEKTPVLLMSVHFISMWKQLIHMGIKPERIVFPYMEKPYFENDAELCNMVEKIEFEKEYFICKKKNGENVEITDEKTWRDFLREVYRDYYPLIQAVAKMDTEPVSRQFGTERGTPIDRYYIEKFLHEHEAYIYGDVLEIEDNSYTKQFGWDRVHRSIIMDVNSRDSRVTFNGNLETGEGIQEEIADCVILTQTLMYIFDLKNAAHQIGRLLKKGGTALITCSGISQNSRRCMEDYGCYFNFNVASLVRMFETEHELEVIESGSSGNAKTVTAHISGVCCEDLKQEDFMFEDKCYPLIVYAVVKKNE